MTTPAAPPMPVVPLTPPVPVEPPIPPAGPAPPEARMPPVPDIEASGPEVAPPFGLIRPKNSSSLMNRWSENPQLCSRPTHETMAATSGTPARRSVKRTADKVLPL